MQLGEVKKLLDKVAVILEFVSLPIKLNQDGQSVIQEFVDHHKDLTKNVSDATTSEAAGFYRQQIESIKNYYNAVFEISSGNKRILIINTIYTFGSELSQVADERALKIIKEIEGQTEVVKGITKELSDKATHVVISDYALIFGEQEIYNGKRAAIWLSTALILASAFIIILIFSITENWINVTTSLSKIENNVVSTKEVFNYPLLIAKFLIISFVIYIITFCFKQYSVNKHLQVINQHRKNAINSYRLFEASLEKNDATKNILMLELAKAIYESTQTGFITKSDDSSNSKFIEWTKMVGNNAG